MQAGNVTYRTARDLPETVPVFPLAGALLLPGGQMPLNVFEPRYLEMVDAVLRGNRLIGMIQPQFSGACENPDKPELCAVGCLGRLASFAETGDGRYLISLHGVCRFRVAEELAVRTPYRQCRITPFISDLDDSPDAGASVDREELLRVFRAYLEANDLEADWESVRRAGNDTLVNALSMMSPYGPAEKQALLEAPDLKSRAETLIAITEMALARDNDDLGKTLQ
ncbi:LON peptidase substrate-binding domain-containing protein [Oricola thermophila]|uniref:LON peptidase substrate-binding domain-containing protein n=1 Tax=Oricola thermophila TaxID=2742145 RepID=A0A6N1VG14_9HYPH|nr:LON peptidase substrate-binding domain-containing protein [Oricola thermophila]QKV19870.1 LON peptidase substrate-binding domain-containing protein [Oricola thermophila]